MIGSIIDLIKLFSYQTIFQNTRLEYFHCRIQHFGTRFDTLIYQKKGEKYKEVEGVKITRSFGQL